MKKENILPENSYQTNSSLLPFSSNESTSQVEKLTQWRKTLIERCPATEELFTQKAYWLEDTSNVLWTGLPNIEQFLAEKILIPRKKSEEQNSPNLLVRWNSWRAKSGLTKSNSNNEIFDDSYLITQTEAVSLLWFAQEKNLLSNSRGSSQPRNLMIYNQTEIDAILNKDVSKQLAQISIDDHTNRYFVEITRVPLLKKFQELSLAQAITAGKKSVNTLEEQTTHSNQSRLRAQVELSYYATEWLRMANTRLVLSVAKKYNFSVHGLHLLDLAHEGMTGLDTAIQRYEWEKGHRFSTYATWWIRQAITRSIANNGRTIRIPVNTIDKLNKLKKHYNQLEEEHGRTPTWQELADKTGQTVEEVQSDWLLDKRPRSLQEPLNPLDGLEEFVDIIPDANDLDVSDVVSLNLFAELVPDLYETLTPREARVIKLRVEEGLTLEQVGKKIGLTRERIRQIEKKGIGKMKNHLKYIGIKSIDQVL